MAERIAEIRQASRKIANRGLAISGVLLLGGGVMVWDGSSVIGQIEQTVNQEFTASQPDLAGLSDADIQGARVGQAAFARNVDSLLADYKRGEARETPESLLARIQYSTEAYGLGEARQVLQRMDERSVSREPIAARYNPHYALRVVESVIGVSLLTVGVVLGFFSRLLWSTTRGRLAAA